MTSNIAKFKNCCLYVNIKYITKSSYDITANLGYVKKAMFVNPVAKFVLEVCFL